MIWSCYLLDGTKENHEVRMFGLSPDVCMQDILNAKQVCYPHSTYCGLMVVGTSSSYFHVLN